MASLHAGCFYSLYRIWLFSHILYSTPCMGEHTVCWSVSIEKSLGYFLFGVTMSQCVMIFDIQTIIKIQYQECDVQTYSKTVPHIGRGRQTPFQNSGTISHAHQL